MIFGKIEDIRPGALATHNDLYSLTPQTNYFVVRPFRPIGVGLGMALVMFAWGCRDLLYAHELTIIGGAVLALVLFGETFAHLSIVNRDLRGSEQSIALWGSYGALNEVRRKIAAVNPSAAGGSDQ